MKEEYLTIYAIMPSYLYSTKLLTCDEKLIAERITALCRKEGYAWITNKALANMYGIREDTVSKHIRNLKDFGYIKCIYEKNNKGRSNRTIYLTNGIWNDQAITNGIYEQEKNDHSSGHNNKDKYKKNNKKNETDKEEYPGPAWLFDEELTKGGDYELNNPEDARMYKELKGMFAPYMSDENEE